MDEWITQLYKSKGGFAKNTLENRRSTAAEKRRGYRNSILTQFRQIPQIMSPLHLDEKIEVVQEKPKKSKRLEMLEKWKKEKERKELEAKKNKKPLFKVCRVRSNENLNEVYSLIKGKKIIKEKAAASIQSDNEKKIPKPTSSLQASKIENSHKHGKTLRDTNVTKIDKKTNAKSIPSSTIIFNRHSTNKGHVRSSSIPHKISQATTNQSEINKKTKPHSVHNTGDFVINQKLNDDLITRKLIKISSNKLSPNIAINSKVNLQCTSKDCKVPRKKTPYSKKHTHTSAKIEKLNISTNNKSVKSASDTQESTSSSNNTSVPDMEQTYTETQMNRTGISVEIDTLNISANNKSVKSVSDSQASTSNFISVPNVEQINTETQTVIENSQSPCMSFAAESMLPISANQSSETSRMICDNDYTLKIKHTNNSTERIENKSLRISLQKLNIEKMIASKKNTIRENGLENLVENLSGTEKRMKGKTPNGRKSEYITNCFVNLTPLAPNLCMMESTPLPHHSEKIIKTRRSIRTSRISSNNQTKTHDKEFDLSIPNMESIQCNKSTKKNKSTNKKKGSLSHQKINILNDISIISTSNEEKFVQDDSVTDLRNSSKSHRSNIFSSDRKRNSTRFSVVLNKVSSEEALNEGEISDTFTSARLTRRGSRRILDMMLKKNASTLENESTLTPQSDKKRRSRSMKSRTSIINTPKAAWNLKINDTFEKNTTNISVKRNKTNKRKSIPISQSLDEKYFTPNKSASDKESSDNVFVTPKLSNDNEEMIAYISPFVTTSRGKAAARKDYHMRKSLEGFDSSIAGSTDPKSPKAAAAYFERMLNREIVRIQELCEVWQNYKESDNVSDDACGLIDMTIGQSNLLISKKFKQFRGLIDRCKNNDQVEMKVQCEDLHGFWDMIFKQVQDLDKRFENLEDMKKNNWLEEVPRKRTPMKKGLKKKKRKGGRAKSKTEASSLLKEAILAARKKKAQSQSDGNLEIIIAKKNGTPDRKILANSSMVNLEKNPSTPARGILKSATAKSENRKTVAFVEALTSVSHKENMGTPTFFRKDTPRPTRQSNRISLGRNKLVFD